MMPLAAHALNEKVWLTVNGGGGKYDMSELNAEIAAFNAADAGSGLAFPLVEDGVSWGGAVGYETPGQLHGSSPLYEAHGGGSWWATPRFALVATAGYRYAKLKALKVEGGAFINSNGEALAVDYSGPYFRVGFKVAGNADQ